MKPETKSSILGYLIPWVFLFVAQLWLPKPEGVDNEVVWAVAIAVLAALETWLLNLFVFPFFVRLFSDKKDKNDNSPE